MKAIHITIGIVVFTFLSSCGNAEQIKQIDTQIDNSSKNTSLKFSSKATNYAYEIINGNRKLAIFEKLTYKDFNNNQYKAGLPFTWLPSQLG